MERKHVHGIELSRRFYQEAVQPLPNRHFGPLTHTAALIGTGSEGMWFMPGLTAALAATDWRERERHLPAA